MYLLCNFRKIKNVKTVKSIVKDILIILLLTAFYLIPLLEHKMYGDYTIYNAEEMGATGQDVYNTTIGFKEWLSSEFSNKELTLSFGIIITFGMLITPFALKRTKGYSAYIDFWLLAIIALYMSSKFFPWMLLPNVFTIIQFAWRLNGFFIFFISYICAINIFEISEMIRDNKNIIAIITTVMIFVCSWFGVARYMPKEDDIGISSISENNSKGIADKYKIDIKFERDIINLKKIGPYQINREYLPLKACINIPYIENREDKTYVIEGNAIVDEEIKNGLTDNIKITTEGKSTLELPYIYYHGYTVKLNGKNIKTYESNNGFLCVDIEESGDLSIEYTGTVLEKIGYAISGTGLIIGLIYIGIMCKKKANNTYKGAEFEK